ncbi:MAG: DUF4136 domain-containing protein [Gammaproteobacteria bacterium]|nr:MAG: DUF4136 domain-containing protein [Gammaproteobacteria bacterium]
MPIVRRVPPRNPSAIGLFLVVATLLLSACASGPQVRASAAPEVDFSAFHTFAFLEPLSTDRAGFHTLVSQQLAFSTQRELEVRGLQFVADPARADLLINFYVDAVDRFRVRSTTNRWNGPTYWNHRTGFYDPWRGHRNWPQHSTLTVDEFTEGLLNVDVIDARRNMLVWEGLATKRLTQRTLNDFGPALDNAVHHIFREFPLEPQI